MKDKTAYPEILADLADKAGRILVKAGLGSDRAALLGLDIAEAVRADWGGQPIYISKGDEYVRSLRDLEIFGKFRGNNYAALAREYGLSTMRIRQVVKSITAEMVRKSQGSLF